MYGIPSCGCLPGSEFTGWHEVRSSFCLAAEKREFGISRIIAKKVATRAGVLSDEELSGQSEIRLLDLL